MTLSALFHGGHVAVSSKRERAVIAIRLFINPRVLTRRGDVADWR
jgi:hypothetical protein